MVGVLLLAGVYNLAWGTLVITLPGLLFDWAAMEPPRYPQIWQCVGMIVGVYGIGYLLAARDPLRHWPIVLVGLLGKVLGPIGFLFSALSGDLPWAWGATIVTNDLIWWVPFSLILYHAWRQASAPSPPREPLSWSDALRGTASHRGATLEQLSADRPLLVVCLRHAGCAFCREALSDLAQQRGEIERLGVRIAVIHMSDPMQATQMFARYGLDDVHRFSDTDRRLYDALGVPRGRLAQIVNPKVILRGLDAAFLRGHGLAGLQGDVWQMPGVILLSRSRIVRRWQAKTAGDRPRYVELAGGDPAKAPPFGPLNSNSVDMVL